FSKPLIERSFLNLLSFIGHLNQFNSLRKTLFGNVTSKGIYRLAGSAGQLPIELQGKHFGRTLIA
ncbi:MAG: hypothetical protein Q9M28_08250, partial [Mariprofundaceae bacterium]|nr:hypothetical protein [Mariprofundaceae bacterium]